MPKLQTVLDDYFLSGLAHSIVQATIIKPKVISLPNKHQGHVIFVLTDTGSVIRKDLNTNTIAKLISGIIDIVDLRISLGLLTKTGRMLEYLIEENEIKLIEGLDDVVQFEGFNTGLSKDPSLYILRADGRLYELYSEPNQIKTNIVQIIKHGYLFLVLDIDGNIFAENLEDMLLLVPTKEPVARMISPIFYETITRKCITRNDLEGSRMLTVPLLITDSYILYKDKTLINLGAGTVITDVLFISEQLDRVTGFTSSGKVFRICGDVIQWHIDLQPVHK